MLALQYLSGRLPKFQLNLVATPHVRQAGKETDAHTFKTTW
jgi:hypothetical protein